MMEVTETVSEGLKRELKVVVDAKELRDRLDARLEELKNHVRIKGFRPGKVPLEHLRKVYGQSVMAEILQQAISETSQQALMERSERPAHQPKIALADETAGVEDFMRGNADLEYTMSFEILPDMEIVDLRNLSLEKQVAEVQESDVDKAISQLLESSTSYEPKSGAAKKGDRVTVDFVGKIDGEPFEGGAAEDVNVVIGKEAFIPGFEDGLKGAKAGEERTVKARFPEDYPEPKLAGKEAEFEVKVKEVAAPKLPKADDEFAKGMGFESLDKLREAVREKLGRELEGVSRAKLKRALLDALDKAHDFELPASLVEAEFNYLWQNLTRGLEQEGKTLADVGKDEEAEKERLRKLAERRVRLGLVLSELGRRNEIEVTDEELKRAMLDHARQYPGQEKQVIEYYRKHPEALGELRGPIYEDKVVEFALALTKLRERKVSSEELFKSPEDEDDGDQ